MQVGFLKTLVVRFIGEKMNTSCGILGAIQKHCPYTQIVRIKLFKLVIFSIEGRGLGWRQTLGIDHSIGNRQNVKLPEISGTLNFIEL